MQIALDIPEPLYEKLKVVAASDGITVEQAMLCQLQVALGFPLFEDGPVITFDGPRGMPRIHAKEPGTMQLAPEDVNAYALLP